MPLKFTGGSLTLSIGILAAAWTLRTLQDQRRRSANRTGSGAPRSKHTAALSLDAIALLVALQPLPFCIIDTRAPEAAEAAPLAAWLRPAVLVPEPQLQQALSSDSGWLTLVRPASAVQAAVAAAPAAAAGAAAAGLPGGQPASPERPRQHHLLLILADGGPQHDQALCRAAAASYDRVAVPAQGIQQLLHNQHTPGSSTPEGPQGQQQPPPEAAAAAAAAAGRFPPIHADALAVLLGLAHLPEEAWQLLLSQHAGPCAPPQPQPHAHASSSSPRHSRSHSSSSLQGLAGADGGAGPQPEGHQQPEGPPRLLLLDVRRHDERSLFGTIPGSHHLPVDELAPAQQLGEAEFRARHHFDPPDRQRDVVVLHSRGCARATWAAQLLADAGVAQVLLYPEGVLGWPFGMAVEAYQPYQQGEVPPPAEELPLREPDVAAGVMELQQLGLLPLLMQQHGRLQGS